MIVLTESTREKVLLAAQVRAAQRGDQQAFGQLVERFQRAVYGVALRRLRNHAEAQELVQEVFVQAMRKIGQLREPECFGGWLRSITARMAINRAMRGGPVVPTDRETLEATCVERRTPLAAALERERASQVRAGLRSVADVGPENARGVLRPRSVADRNERRVRLANWHDQAAVARRSQAARSRVAGIGASLTSGLSAGRISRVVRHRVARPGSIF